MPVRKYRSVSSHFFTFVSVHRVCFFSVPSLRSVSFSILMCQMFNHVQSQCSLSTCSIWQTRSVEDILWLNPFGFKQCFNPWQNSIHLGLNHPQAGRISNTWLKYAEICMGQPFNVHKKHQTGQPVFPASSKLESEIPSWAGVPQQTLCV